MSVNRKRAKRSGLKALLLLLSSAVAAQAQTLRKDLQKDFGATGNGRTDDQGAFHRAADFFNQRAKTPAGANLAVLYIPRGTYRVGTPGHGSMADLLALRGCRNLRIVGDDSARTIIRYADSLRYGTFDPATHQPYEPPVAYYTNWEWGVRGSTAIKLQACDNVEVNNLTLDGNSPHLVIGGHWGDTGIQLDHDGVLVNNSRRVRLRQLAVHHFGRDGIQVLNQLAGRLDNPAQEGILLENARFDYNGRQGLSITGVNGLRAVNCSFSHTGRVLIPALGKPLYSNPGAGIDIEPEGGGYASNVQLENCRLVDNAGQALVSDRYGNGPPHTGRIVLRNCLLWGVTNWSVWLRQPGFLFDNCRIYGAFENGCRARDASWATRFVGCTFADRPYHGRPAYGPALLHSDQEARGMSFVSCRFEATRSNLLYAVPAAPPDTASRFRLRNCAFVLSQAGPVLAGPNVLAGATLGGDVVLEASPQHADTTRTELVLGAAGVPGSAVLRPGSHLRLLAPRCRLSLPGGILLQEQATLEIGAGAEVVFPGQSREEDTLKSTVAAGARILVRRGGKLTLQGGTQLVLAGGNLVIEKGATLQRHSTAEVRGLKAQMSKP